MKTTSVHSTSATIHSQTMQGMLAELITHARAELDHVEEPRFQALLETTAEVLKGLQTAYRDYDEGTEKAWKR
jgi:hypothetical protein